jgi:hypothetical protein
LRDVREEDALRLRRATAAAVIAAPLLFLVVNVLHPKEFSRGHETEQLREIAAHYTRWQLAHLLTFIAILLLVVAVIGLAWLVWPRRPRAAIIGGLLGLFGLVAVSGVLALDGFTWGVLGEVSVRPGVDSKSIQVALHDVQESKWNLPFYVGALAWLIGLVILSVALIRERLVPAWAGWTFAAGAVLVGIEAGVQDNVYFIVAAAVLAIGGVGVGTAIMRSDPWQMRTQPEPSS